MDRRQYLAAIGVLTTASIAGCSGDDGSENGDDENGDESGDENGAENGNEATPTATVTATPEPEPEFGIAADLPGEVAVGEQFTYEFTLSNTGDGSGTARYGIDLSLAQNDRWESVVEREITLDAGESETIRSDPLSFDNAQTVQLEFWIATDNGRVDTDRADVVVEQPSLNWGEIYRTPTDLRVLAENPRFRDAYTYEDFRGDPTTERAPAGQQFVFVDLRVQNDAGEPRSTPNPFAFELVADDRQYEPILTEYEDDDEYSGTREIVNGVIESGVLPYLVDDGVGSVDLELFYSDQDFERNAEWQVTWG